MPHEHAVFGELVSVTTDDGLRLDGFWAAPDASKSDAPRIDAWILIHGTGSNFYAPSLWNYLTPRILAWGAGVLRINTRGHDWAYATTTPAGRVPAGAAYERIDQAPLDLSAWHALLTRRGCRRIGLIGHSLGAIKAIYSLAQNDPPAVAAVAALSPPRLSHAEFLAGPRGDLFRQTLAEAQAHVASGRENALMHVTFPLPYLVTAAGYLDRYGPDEKYDLVRLLKRVRSPLLITYGSEEIRDVAFREMPEIVDEMRRTASGLDLAIVAGGDHIYTGVHGALLEQIERWLGRVF